MRIAYLTGEYPRATDTFIQSEVAELRRRGVHVRTISIRRSAVREHVGPEQRAEAEGTFYVLGRGMLTIIAAHARCLIRGPGRFFRGLGLAWSMRPPGVKGLIYQLFYFAEAVAVADLMQREDLEHLHNHFGNSSCSVATIASAVSGRPYSFTLHGPAIFFEPHRWRLDRKIERADFVCCISNFCRSQAMIFSDPAHWSRLHIVHCGVDPDLFEPADRSPASTRRLLYVGRLAAVKGLSILLEALESIDRDDIELVVVGDGPDRAALEAEAARRGLGDAVRFVGYRSRHEVRDHLLEADLFVMSSFAEGVPVVLMEAMASGVPVIAPRIAGIPELIEDGVSGYLTPPGDVLTLADRIVRLLDDDTTRRAFVAAGRDTVVREFCSADEAARIHALMTGGPGATETRGVSPRPAAAAQPAPAGRGIS